MSESYSETTHTHHPDCLYWFDQYHFECTCGLTSREHLDSRLKPWTKKRFNEWKERIKKILEEEQET